MPRTPARSSAPSRRQQVSDNLTSLKTANRNRMQMAEAKREIARGERSPRDLIKFPPEPVRNMKVVALLKAIPLVGAHRAQTICLVAGVNPLMTLGALTARQRVALIDALDIRGPS